MYPIAAVGLQARYIVERSDGELWLKVSAAVQIANCRPVFNRVWNERVLTQ